VIAAVTAFVRYFFLFALDSVSRQNSEIVTAFCCCLKMDFAVFLLQECRRRPELPDFSWYNIPKRGKHTKLPQNIRNGHNMYDMASHYSKYCTKSTSISHCEAFQNRPIFLFLV
jgi:hypothetical protein